MIHSIQAYSTSHRLSDSESRTAETPTFTRKASSNLSSYAINPKDKARLDPASSLHQQILAGAQLGLQSASWPAGVQQFAMLDPYNLHIQGNGGEIKATLSLDGTIAHELQFKYGADGNPQVIFNGQALTPASSMQELTIARHVAGFL